MYFFSIKRKTPANTRLTDASQTHMKKTETIYYNIKVMNYGIGIPKNMAVILIIG